MLSRHQRQDWRQRCRKDVTGWSKSSHVPRALGSSHRPPRSNRKSGSHDAFPRCDDSYMTAINASFLLCHLNWNLNTLSTYLTYHITSATTTATPHQKPSPTNNYLTHTPKAITMSLTRFTRLSTRVSSRQFSVYTTSQLQFCHQYCEAC